jgi:DNA polymerase-3 subunit alpha
LQPTSIEDVAAVNALYRPGPMQNIDSFVARKHGKEKITYPVPQLQPILENTYGIIVYQEQVMQVLQKMGGFTLGQADIIRRAMGKKQKSVIDEWREKFIAGANKLGFEKSKAEEVYDYIERFANYGFNRSHAFAYSVVGYQLAYLKAHYPGAFFTAIMRAARTKKDLKEYVAQAKKAHVQVLGPDINFSSYTYTLTDEQTIRFGLTAIKGARGDFVHNIIEEKRMNGPYSDFEQFLLRIDRKWLKEDTLMPLILTGTFDSLESNRRKLGVDLSGKIQNVLISGGSMDLLDVLSLKETIVEDYQLEDKLNFEEEYLGTYLSAHPTESFAKLKAAKLANDVLEVFPDMTVKLILLVREIKVIRTKKGTSMAFLEAGDATGDIAITVFPNLYLQVARWIKTGAVIYVEGKSEKSKFNGETQVVAERLVLAETELKTVSTKKLFLRLINEKEDYQAILPILKRNHGHIPVILFLSESNKKLALKEPFWVKESATIQAELIDLLGRGNAIFQE